MRKTSSSRAAYNEALGITVNQLLFEHRLTRKELAAHFGVTQPVVSRKLRGQVNWTAEELSIMAGLFGLSMDSFTPVRADDGWAASSRSRDAMPGACASTMRAAMCSRRRDRSPAWVARPSRSTPPPGPSSSISSKADSGSQ